jgi:hypothetical protein
VLTSGGQEAVLNIINAGQAFGEIALLDGQPRTADAVAMTDCELMVIDRRDFIPVLRREPDVALKLIETLCARIRRTSEQVEDVMYLSLPARLAKTLLELTGGLEASATQRRVSITQRELSKVIAAYARMCRLLHGRQPIGVLCQRSAVHRQLHVLKQRFAHGRRRFETRETIKAGDGLQPMHGHNALEQRVSVARAHAIDIDLAQRLGKQRLDVRIPADHRQSACQQVELLDLRMKNRSLLIALPHLLDAGEYVGVALQRRTGAQQIKAGAGWAIMFYMKNRMRWAERDLLELTGKDGGPIDQNITVEFVRAPKRRG